jgi:surface protein
MFKNNKKKKGFGIFEIIIIVAIVSLIATLAVAWLLPNRPKARDAKRVNELNSLRDALHIYYMDYGRYPTSTAENEWCKIEADFGEEDYCEGLYSGGEFILEPHIRRVSDPMFGKDPMFSYQYISATTGMGYRLLANLETKDPYEIVSGGWYAGEVTEPPEPDPDPENPIVRTIGFSQEPPEAPNVTLMGNVDDTGGDEGSVRIIERGFEVYTALGGYYNPSESGNWGTGEFNEPLVDLSQCTRHYFRAWAKNNSGLLGEGEEKEFFVGGCSNLIDVYFDPSEYNVNNDYGELEIITKINYERNYPIRVEYDLDPFGTSATEEDFTWAGEASVLRFNPGETQKSFTINILNNEGGTFPKKISFEITDVEGVEIGSTSTAVITIHEGGIIPPIANDDYASTTLGSPVVIDLLANDENGTFDIDPGTVEIKVPPVNGSVEIMAASGAVIYTPDSGGSTFTYTVKDVEGNESNEATVTVDIIEAFTFQIETISANQTFSFQADVAQLNIIWGDGQDNLFTGTGVTGHVYSDPGTYNISLYGEASRISFYEGTPTLLVDILTPVSDGVSGITSAQNMFRGTTNFGTSPLTAPDFFDETSKNITNMYYMFSYSPFNQPIGDWDVGNVTNMGHMFYRNSEFNQPIGNWNVSNVTYMSHMFWRSSQFNQPIGNWNVSNVTDMSFMFSYSSFNQPIGNWDVSNVTDMSYMFGYSPFNQPIDTWNVGWNVGNVTNMSYMFYNSPFNQPIGNWDVGNVTNMYYMFANSPFNQPIGDWDVGNVTFMGHMFYNSPFNQPIGNWNVSNVRYMDYMFTYSSFNQPIGNWNVSNVTNMSYMFYTSPFNQPIDTWHVDWDVGNVTNMSYMFYNSSFNQPIGNWNVSNVTNMSYMFAFSRFNQPIGNWNVGNVTNMSNMLNNTPMSRLNYDALLDGWSKLSLRNGVTFGVLNLKYCNVEARQSIIDNHSWNFEGDVEDDDCSTVGCQVPSGHALHFWDTSGFYDFPLTIPSSESLNITTEERTLPGAGITLEFWIKADTQYNYLIDKCASGKGGYCLYLVDSPPTYPETLTFGGDLEGSGMWQVIVKDGAPAVGEWVHLVVTYSQDHEFVLYKNGEVFHEAVLEGEHKILPSSDLDLGIGNGVRAIMNEVRIYAKVLPPSLVAEHCTGDFSGDISGCDGENCDLRGLWHFEEGSGTDVYDSSGNNNHGTLNLKDVSWVSVP